MDVIIKEKSNNYLFCCGFCGNSYERLQSFEKNSKEHKSIFSVNQGTLPSHIRSIKMVRQSSLQTLVQRHDDVIRKRRTAVVIIFMMSVVALFAALTILKAEKGKDHRQYLIEGNASLNVSSKNITVYDVKGKLHRGLFPKRKSHNVLKVVKANIRRSNTRMYCNSVCHQYSAFRFRSSCQQHKCKCQGRGYQHESCLPKVRGCVIQKDSSTFAHAKFQQKEQSIFSCIAYNTLGPEVHVLSNYGNTHKGRTEVHVTGNRTNSSEIILVLANYQKVKWNLRIQNSVNIQKVYLVSNKNLRRSRVSIEVQHDGEIVSKTEIVKIFSHVGYGEDRFGGHTRELLETINKQIGDVTSFSGTSNANYWIMNLEKMTRTKTAIGSLN